MRIWLYILLFLPAFCLQAAEVPQLDHNYDQLFKILMDDPSAMKDWAGRQLQTDLESQDAFTWARITAIYISACMEIGCEGDPLVTEENLRKTLAIAEKGQDPPLVIRIHLMLDGIFKDSGVELTDFQASLGPIRKLAEDLGGGRLLADVYRAYAAAAESESNLQQALIYAKNALDLAEKHGYPGDILPILVKNDSAILAGRIGDQSQAISLYLQVIEYCKKEGIRHMGAIALINLGRHYTREGHPERIREGLAYFDQASVMIRELNQDRLAAFSFLTRGEALLNLKDFDQAHHFIDEAIKLFRKLDSTIWTADSVHWKARVFLAQKRWAEALDLIDQAESLFPEHLQNDKAILARERAEALNGLNKPVEAYRSLLHFVGIHEKLDEKNRTDQLNSLQVQFGYKLQEQENRLLKKENELKELQLREAELIKKLAIVLGVLILICLSLLFFALLQVRNTRQAKAKIQHILDNIEEGIVTVGRDLKVESSLSPYLDHVIGHDAPESARQNVMLYLLDKSDLRADERQMIRELITSCIDESDLVWELNVGNLPQSLSLDHGQRILSLHWQPLYGKDRRIKQIIVAMRDNTMQQKLEHEIGQARAERSRLQHIMEEVSQLAPQRFQQFLRSAKPRAELIRTDGRNLRRHLPELHSLKGEARSLGLKDLASITHQLEDLWDERRPVPANEEDIQRLLATWQDTWMDYERMGLWMGTQSDRKARQEPQSLVQSLADQWTSLHQHCQSLGLQLQRIRIEEDIFSWSSEFQQAIKDILLHSLINSIDHGFKDPAHSLKPELAIKLQRDEQGRIELSIQDNGRGLNWTKLHEIIKERNFVPAPGQSLADVVFLEGLTTAEQVSQTSGRGVGLAAIRRIAQALEGDVHIKDRGDQPGCELVIHLKESA